MKKILILTTAFVLRLFSTAIAQNGDMMSSRGNSSFSTTEVLLGIIVAVLVIGALVWIVNNRNGTNRTKK